MTPRLLSNDELERAARDSADPLLQEAVRRLVDGGDGEEDDFDAYSKGVDAAEAESNRLEHELESMAQLCAEAAAALRENACGESCAELIKRLEEA